MTRKVKLKDVCREITVGHVGPMADSYVDSGIPFLRSQNVEPFRIDKSNLKFISDAFHKKLKKSALRPGDVVVVRTGYPGTASVIPADLPISNCADLVVIRPSEQINGHFLCSLFNSVWGRGHVAGNLVGVAQQHFNIGAAKEMEFALPPIGVQRKVASILSAYGNLIENNTRRIQVLKAMSRTVFNGGSQSSSEPWNLVPIRELYEELFDGPHATPKPSTSGPIYLGIKNVTEQGELDLTDIRHIAEDDFPQWTRRVVPQSGDIVFTYEATLNRYGIIGGDFRGCLGRRMALIRPDKARIDSFLLLQCLLSNQWRDEVRSKTISGATVDRIPLTTFPSFQISIPGPEARRRIAPTIRACEELAENCRKRNDVLRKTRDLLLPKLVSGEISVEQIEKEAVAEMV